MRVLEGPGENVSVGKMCPYTQSKLLQFVDLKSACMQLSMDLAEDYLIFDYCGVGDRSN